MNILQTFGNVFKIKELRDRIFVTLLLITIFEVGAHIILPGVDPNKVKSAYQDQQGFLWGMLQIISAGAFGRAGLCSLGIGPYITASIIMSLLTKVDARLEAIAKEGPGGQRRINQYTRLLAVPICLIQAFFMVKAVMGPRGIATGDTIDMWIMMVAGLTAGGIFVMWLGEQISELGIGNGASVLIMIGILSRLPLIVGDMINQVNSQPEFLKNVIAIFVIYVVVIAAIVAITQSQRRIPIQSAKQFRGRRMVMGSRNYLPLRVNTAGVMPVIFASALMSIPYILAQIPFLRWLEDELVPGHFLYALLYVVFIMFFSYFWTYLFYKPQELANNLKEYGNFVPGIRPGEPTERHIDFILARITLFGAVFLCTISLLPDIAANVLGTRRYLVAFLGGTGILIVVGVCIDLIQKIESYLLLHHYTGFVGSSSPMRGRR